MEKENQSYKIVGLQIENLRKIKAAYLEFADKGLIQVKGRNNAGKSTVIDAFEILMKGFSNVEKGMITEGEEVARIIGKVGPFTITRRIGKSTSLEITTEDGLAVAHTPQTFLDRFINEFTFNPQPFLDKSAEMKLKFILDLLGIDFSKENDEISRLSEERRFKSRTIKEMGKPSEPEKVTRVDVQKLYDKKREVSAKRGPEEQKENNLEFFNGIAEMFENAINEENHSEPIKEGSKDLLNGTKAIIDSLPKPEYELIDKELESLDEQIMASDNINDKAKDYENYLTELDKYNKAVEEYNKFDSRINKLRNDKIQRVSSAEMPLKGLAITEEGLFYNGVFCENWSKSDGWKIALALCSAMNPKLRAVFLDNGEALDTDSRKELDNWAKKNDIQVILTIVDTPAGVLEEGVFYIEEGTIKTKAGECKIKSNPKDQ